MTHELALTLALISSLALNYALGWWARECRCDQCAFHKHERRVAAEKARVEAEAESRRQADLRHEYQHKGGGFVPSDPDRFNCNDTSCRRNRA